MKQTFKFLTLFLLTLLGTSINLWAGQSMRDGSTLTYKVNGTEYTASYGAPTNNLGTITSEFVLTKATWNCQTDWDPYCDAYICWKINDSNPTEFLAYQGFHATGRSAYDTWFSITNSNLNKTIANSTNASGNYTFEHWWYVQFWNNGGSWNEKSYYNNGGKNYKFTYTILPPAIKENTYTVSITGDDVKAGSGTSTDPYIIKYGGQMHVSISAQQNHSDANSSLNLVVYNDNEDTDAKGTSLDIKNITNTTASHMYVKGYYKNGDLKGAQKEEAIYYKAETLYTVTVGKTTGGTVSPDGDQSVGTYTSKTLTASNNTGYHFVDWTTTGGANLSTTDAATTTLTASAAGTVTANFEENKYIVTATKTEGGASATVTTSPAGQITGTAINAVADDGYVFVRWDIISGSGSFDKANTIADNTFKPTAQTELRAVFSRATVTVTSGKVGNGTLTAIAGEYSVTIGTDNEVPAGQDVVFTATPDPNYTIEGWYNNIGCEDGELQKGDNTGNPQTYTIENIAEAKTVYVKFKETDYTITLSNGTGISAIKVEGTTQTSVTAHVATKTATITADVATGYTWKEWTVSTNNITATPNLNINGIQINATSTGILTASATPKTYTVSFSQEGGTGGQTETVTATYDAAMPALSSFTAPVMNGYKFMGYEYNGTLYYNERGESARDWNVDEQSGAVTLTAKWDQIHVYIEGRFRVRATKDAQDWVTPGSSASDYVENSKNIEFNFDDVKNIYTLNTWAYVDELAAQVNSQDLNFHIATCVGDDGALTQMYATADGSNFWFNKEHKNNTLVESGNKNLWFQSNTNDDFSGPVILTYDPTANTLSYTAEPEQTYTVTFIAGGHGHLNEEGPRSVGVRSGYNITATADKGYHFVRFDKTGYVTVNATNNTAKITVTGEGTVTATFAADTRVYFTKPSSWTGSEVYAYFDTYWSENKTSGDTYEGAGSKGKADGKKMEQVTGNVYAVSYSGNEAKSEIAFVNDKQNDYQAFDQTSATYRPDFNRCSTKNWFDTENKKTGDYNKHDGKQTAYYNDGKWKSYQDMPVEFYMRNSLNWDKVCYDQCFKPTSDPNIYEMIWPVSTLTGFSFKVWQTCDCWYGKQNTTINTDGQSINLECNTSSSYDISFTPWKVGSYEFKLDISTMNLKVNFLDDIVVEDFPQEISVLNSRQYKITPNVRFFNNTKAEDITIEVAHTGGISNLATYTQSGTNLIVLGDATKTGQETVNVYYKKGSETIQTRTLIVNVAQPITIQADMSEVAATETHWTNTNLVHIHFWGTDADKSQDAQMTYNETEKVYSVTVPKILGENVHFNFIIWYGESLSMLGGDNAKWRQTANLATDDNTCYTMGAYTADNANRTATPGIVGSLCLPDVYQVEVYMKNGRTYTSNSVTASDEDKTMSFFAPKDNDNTYSGGQVYLLNNGTIVSTITGFSQADVYTATLNIPATGNASLSDITAYNGDYYVIAGVSGSELNDDTKMHKFTPRANTTEDYSYYWTKYTGNCTDKNVIAKVANKYNSNLSLTIGADALTQADGKVEAGNVRFSYEPTTNAFKRAILGASNSDDFLNVYGNNVYADAAATQLLDKNQSLNLSKFADNSDWVYEKVVYVKVDNEESESKVTLKSVFNGQTSHLLGYEIDETTGEEKKDSPNQLTVLGKGSTTGASAYAIRISYDFKKNRLISSWEPTEGTYDSDMSINSDVLFIRTEDGNVQQVQVATKDGGKESYKISSLQHVMFVMEIDGTDKTSYSQYWISLPFDCQISDIFGVEGYITLDENRIALNGTWGIMRYRGDLRAQKGWFKETDGFWEWMYENETMNAGEGYVLFFERSSIKDWPTIKVGDEDKTLKRLYFPSKDAGFEMTNTVDAEHSQFTCEPMRCNIKTPEDREAYDSNWRVIGPKSYNNITAQTIQTDNPYGTQTQFPSFLYTYDTSKGEGQKYIAHNGETFNYQSFHSYMVQYEGTITWVPYTQTTPATVAAHYVEDSNFKGGTLTIELMQNNEQLDRTFVKLDEKGTTGFDFSQDMTKITENAAQIASISENVLYAGSTLPLDIELVPLNVKVVANGTYDIALKQSLEGLEVKLFDAFEQTITPLDMMSATVTLEKGEYKDRFFLQLTQKAPQTPTSFDGKLEQYNLPMDKTQKLLFNGNIYLINAGRVYNATGAELR